MADSIRAAAERLLEYLEANRGHDGMFPLSESQEEFNLRAALAAELPTPTPTPTPTPQELTDEQLLELAEKKLCIDFIKDAHEERYPLEVVTDDLLAIARAVIAAHKPAPAPAPAAEGEREELAALLIGDAECLEADRPDLMSATNRQLHRATDLLRQLPPDGLEAIRYCVEENGAVIQRTSRAPESWAIRSCSSCMSTTGEWDIEPMPSDRTDEWLANHRWPSAAAAWAALQQARHKEVGDE